MLFDEADYQHMGEEGAKALAAALQSLNATVCSFVGEERCGGNNLYIAAALAVGAAGLAGAGLYTLSHRRVGTKVDLTSANGLTPASGNKTKSKPMELSEEELSEKETEPLVASKDKEVQVNMDLDEGEQARERERASGSGSAHASDLE